MKYFTRMSGCVHACQNKIIIIIIRCKYEKLKRKEKKRKERGTRLNQALCLSRNKSVEGGGESNSCNNKNKYILKVLFFFFSFFYPSLQQFIEISFICCLNSMCHHKLNIQIITLSRTFLQQSIHFLNDLLWLNEVFRQINPFQ